MKLNPSRSAALLAGGLLVSSCFSPSRTSTGSDNGTGEDTGENTGSSGAVPVTASTSSAGDDTTASDACVLDFANLDACVLE